MGKLRKFSSVMCCLRITHQIVCYSEVLKDWYLSLDMKRIKGDEMYKTYSMNWTVEKRVLIFDP